MSKQRRLDMIKTKAPKMMKQRRLDMIKTKAPKMMRRATIVRRAKRL
jgi:hypothetical protein